MSVGNFSTSALPAQAYKGAKVLTGARNAKPDPATVPQRSVYTWDAGGDTGTLIWMAISGSWWLIQVLGYSGDEAGLSVFDAQTGEYVPEGLMIATGTSFTYKWDGSAWVLTGPTHGVWVGAANSPDFGLPEYGDEGLQDGDMGVTNTADVPIWWRFCESAREWYRVAELGQASSLDAVRTSWFDANNLPVVAGTPVSAQGWSSSTVDTVAEVGGFVEITDNDSGVLSSASGTVSDAGLMAIVIRDLDTTYPGGVSGQARIWSGALTDAVADRLAALQCNPAWSPATGWFIGGSANTDISGSDRTAVTTIEVYVSAAGVCRIYLDRAATPAFESDSFALGTSAATYRASVSFSSITSGNATLRCSKYAAIAFRAP